MRDRLDAAQERVADAKSAAGERMTDARTAAGERMTDARTAAGDRVADAKAAAGEMVADAKAATADAIAKVKPRLRGVSHEVAFFVSRSSPAVRWSPSRRAARRRSPRRSTPSRSPPCSGRARSITAWTGNGRSARRWMRRLDHSMIFLLIAGTVTPFALLVMERPIRTALLIAVWSGAIAGIVVELIWVDAPKWFAVIVYVAVGLDRRPRLPGDRDRGWDRGRRIDRRRRRALHDGRDRLRAPEARPDTRRCSATTRSSTRW